MRLLRPILLTLAALAFVCVASADTLQFTGTATTTTLTIHDNVIGTETGYIDPYLGKLNNVPVIMFCVDPDHNVHWNDIWQVYITTAPSADWSHTFLNNSNTYGQMAYLAKLMLATNDAHERQAIQTIIWWLANNSLTADIPSGVNATWWNNELVTLRNNASTHALTSGFEILTDSTPNVATKDKKQEYLILTPEPGSLLLLGSGLIGLAGWRRKSLLS